MGGKDALQQEAGQQILANGSPVYQWKPGQNAIGQFYLFIILDSDGSTKLENLNTKPECGCSVVYKPSIIRVSSINYAMKYESSYSAFVQHTKHALITVKAVTPKVSLVIL